MKDLKTKSKLKRKEKDNKQQTTLTGVAGKLAVAVRSDPELQKRWDAAVVKFSSQTFTSFQTMAKSDILLKAIWPDSKPKIQVRSHQTVSRHVQNTADSLRSDMFSILLSEKEMSKSFSFTCDIWTNRGLNSYLCLTIHFITEDLNLLKFVPWCEYFGKRIHSGHNIKITLEDFLKAVELDNPDIKKTVVLDNAANNKLAIRLLANIEGVWCNIHTLQLSIKDTFKFTSGLVSIQTILDKSQELAKLARRSELRKEELKAACRETGIQYILPQKSIDVRWNSKAESLASVVKLKAAFQYLKLNDISGKQIWEDKVLSGREFKAAEGLLKCLESVKVVSKTQEQEEEARW